MFIYISQSALHWTYVTVLSYKAQLCAYVRVFVNRARAAFPSQWMIKLCD